MLLHRPAPISPLENEMGLIYKNCHITIDGPEVRVEMPMDQVQQQVIVHVMWRGVGLGSPRPSIGQGIKQAVDFIDGLEKKPETTKFRGAP